MSGWEVVVGDGPFLTVEEAANRLRIGRTLAYQLARRYRDTGGAEGLPVVALGNVLRVPRAKLEELAGGSLGDPEPAAVIELDARRADSDPQPAPTRRVHRSPHLGSVEPQSALPFDTPDAS